MPEIITPVEVLEHPMRKDARIVAMDFTTRAVEGEAPIIEYVGSDNSEDRYGSVVDPRGCDSSSYMRSGEGVFCFAHRYDIPTIGKCVKLETKASKLVFTIQFAVEEFDFAATIYRLVKGGYMPGSSIGFIPKEWEEYEAKTVSGYFAENRKYTKWELLELSAVPVPANRNALKLALQDKVVSENELRAFGLDQFIRGELLYIMPRSLALIVDKDGKPVETREVAVPAPAPAKPEQKQQKKVTPKETRRVALRATLKIARAELRDCWGECCDTVYTYCPLCWSMYIGNPPTAQCNCMETLSPEAAAAEQKSIAALIASASQTLDVALAAWDTAEHDALRNFASMAVWDAMWRVDRLLAFEDYWYEEAEEGTVAAGIDEATVRKFVTAVKKDAALMKRFKARAAAEDEPEPNTPEEAEQELNDAVEELMQLWNDSDQEDDDLKTVMGALDDAEERIDEAVAALKQDAEDDKKEKSGKAKKAFLAARATRAGAVISKKNRQRIENARSYCMQAHNHLDELMKEAFPEDETPAPQTLDDEQKKNSFRVICAGCKTERTVTPKDGVVTLTDCATCDGKRTQENRCIDETGVRTIVDGIRSLASPAGEAGTTEGDIEGSSTANRDGSEPGAAEKREGYSDYMKYIMNMT